MGLTDPLCEGLNNGSAHSRCAKKVAVVSTTHRVTERDVAGLYNAIMVCHLRPTFLILAHVKIKRFISNMDPAGFLLRIKKTERKSF